LSRKASQYSYCCQCDFKRSAIALRAWEKDVGVRDPEKNGSTPLELQMPVWGVLKETSMNAVRGSKPVKGRII
jgi:hypothetical protein